MERSPHRYFFVDVECLQDRVNSKCGLLIKELSILDYNTGSVSTFHLFPPNSVNEDSFSLKDVASNNYLKYHRHGFSFNTGLIKFERLQFIFHSLFAHNPTRCIVFVKGNQKLDLLSHSITYPVHFVNLEDLQCPRYTLSLESEFPKCLLFSSNLNRLHAYCAESKVRYFADWFQRIGSKQWNHSIVMCTTCGISV